MSFYTDIYKELLTELDAADAEFVVEVLKKHGTNRYLAPCVQYLQHRDMENRIEKVESRLRKIETAEQTAGSGNNLESRVNALEEAIKVIAIGAT